MPNTEALKFIATASFGLEAIVKRELTKMKVQNLKAQDGRIEFAGDLSTIADANIRLRSADRLLLNMGEFEAYSFDELFEGTKALNWEDFITADGKFTVTGKSVSSKLYSVPDCQAIVKKAVVERLKQKYKIEWFPETGPEYKIQVALLRDRVTLTIDTTGPGLHKRGYRQSSVAAPLKETMAAALIDLSYYSKDRILLDPTCGSGTIPIEAALIAKNIAPGLSRKFVSEGWPQIDKTIWKESRARAYAEIDTDFTPEIYGSDIDSRAIAAARENAELAGVDDCITFTHMPLKNVTLPGDYGVSIMNPPYAERVGDFEDVINLYKDMGRIFNANGTWSVYVLTSYEAFEKTYGKKADAKRKLFNAMIKTDYYQFFGPRPPRVDSNT